MGEVLVRERVAGDLAALVPLLREVHERDRYPALWPNDPVGFLEPADGLAAWVALLAGDCPAVLGHVMLTEADRDVAAALEVAEHEVALVSRLFVASAARGLGAGGRLLAVAGDHARSLGRSLALEVLSINTDAIALYERSGWTRAGTTTRSWAPPGATALVFRAPA